jgi:hypothetical protein
VILVMHEPLSHAHSTSKKSATVVAGCAQDLCRPNLVMSYVLMVSQWLNSRRAHRDDTATTRCFRRLELESKRLVNLNLRAHRNVELGSQAWKTL